MFRLTLFNGITLFVLALTLAAIFARFRLRLTSNWFLVYYAVVLGYAKGFEGSFSLLWVVAGIVLAALLRLGALKQTPLLAVRALELAILGYFLSRCVALLLMWPW